MNYLKLAVKIITAVPQIKDLFEGIVSLYYQQKVNVLEDALIPKEKKRAHLIKQIQEAKTNDEILVYSVILNDYNTGKLQ